MANELIIRRAEINDVVEFNTLVSTLGRVPLFRATFGAFNYSNIVEYSHLALLATCGSDDNAALGFASITDASGMDSLSFENAILELKAYIPVEVTNTLFINFWAVEERNNLGLGDVGVDMINKFFTICPDIDYIVWLCPMSLKLTDYLQRLFEEVESHSETTGKSDIFKGVRILLLRRESYLLALSVRGARVEDSDDLLPILLKSNPAIIDGQEKFFLANLIQTRDDNNRFYVGLTKNKLVGMLATSTDVNELLIKKVFDIDIFSDIVIKSEPKVKLPLKRIALVGNVHFLEKATLADLATELNCIFVDVSTSSSVNNTGDKVGTSILLKLDALIVDACNEYMIQNLDNFPTACILIGLPTTEAEVEAILHTPGSVDVIIEVSRSLGESAAPTAQDVEVEEDAATLSHIDATDLLKTMLSAVTEDGESRVNVQWRLLPDEGDVVVLIADALSEAVATISEETRLLMGDQNEEEQYYSNAFAVTLFCTAEGSETRAVDMLRVAFEDFPGLDYCICLVPNSSPVMPLVELMTAVKVRPGMSFNQSLYVMRKEHFLAKSNLGVVRLTDSLMPDLELFLKPLGIDQKTSLIAAKNCLKFNDACLNDNPMEVSFLLLFGSKVVGFVTLSRKKITNEDVNTLRAGYKLDDLIDYERYRTRSQAMITHWILSPIFSRWSRFTIREIMRLYEKTLLYYQGAFSSIPAVEIVDELIPVAPRRAMQMVSRPRSGSTIASSTVGSKRFDKGPLFMITKSKLSHRKTAINSRILIVGGTAYAHAALETFCYFPNLTFSNIYVVNDRQSSPFLLGDVARFGGDSTFGSEFSGCLSVRDVDDPPLKNLFALGLAYKSTLVRGHLTDIDRENKSIVVSDEVALEYDLLLIASPNQDTTVKSFPSTKGMHPSTCAQRGIFGLGNPLADETALRWVLQRSLTADSSSEGNTSTGGGVVVFGSGTDALAAIGGLIKNNVPSAKISLVIPEIELEELGHNTINESVYLALHQCGVEIYPGHVVVDVIFSNQHTLQSIQLENKHFDAQSPPDRENINFQDQAGERKDSVSDNSNAQTSPQFVKIECATLLCCMRKSCDADVFTAINESGLVYDGGVVVDERFCTTDPSIYAIGSYTRFSRVYRNSVPHIRFNTRELGHFAGHKMIESLLNPSMHKSKSVSVSGRARLMPPVPASSLPVFSCPRTSSVTLPGGLTLLHSSLPGWSGAQESQSLVTGEMGADKLSILKVDLFGCAVQFVFLGSAPIEEQNLSCIVGLHESYLGSALAAHAKGSVLHWTEYFRQSWADMIYHDRLHLLVKELRSSIASDKGMLTVLDKVFSVAASTDDDEVVSSTRKKILGDRCSDVDQSTRMVVEAKSLEFLKKNRTTLINFYVPPNLVSPQSDMM